MALDRPSTASWRKVVPRADAQERDVRREFRRTGPRPPGGRLGYSPVALGGAARAAAGLRRWFDLEAEGLRRGFPRSPLPASVRPDLTRG